MTRKQIGLAKGSVCRCPARCGDQAERSFLQKCRICDFVGEAVDQVHREVVVFDILRKKAIFF